MSLSYKKINLEIKTLQFSFHIFQDKKEHKNRNNICVFNWSIYKYLSQFYSRIPCFMIDCLRVAKWLILVMRFISFYSPKKKKKVTKKNAVRLQRRNLEIFLKGYILKIDFFHDFSNFRMCEINVFINLCKRKRKINFLKLSY